MAHDCLRSPLLLSHSPANAEAASLYRENMKEYVRKVKSTVEESWMDDEMLVSDMKAEVEAEEEEEDEVGVTAGSGSNLAAGAGGRGDSGSGAMDVESEQQPDGTGGTADCVDTRRY